MKSITQAFDEFQKELYPNLTGRALRALRQSFYSGYSCHSEHVLELLKTADPKEGMGKCMALMMSANSFLEDCKVDVPTTTDSG